MHIPNEGEPFVALEVFQILWRPSVKAIDTNYCMSLVQEKIHEIRSQKPRSLDTHTDNK